MKSWEELGKRIAQAIPNETAVAVIQKKERVEKKTAYHEIEEINRQEKKKKKREVAVADIRRKRRGERLFRGTWSTKKSFLASARRSSKETRIFWSDISLDPTS